MYFDTWKLHLPGVQGVILFWQILLKRGLQAQYNTVCFSFAARTMAMEANQFLEELREF